MLNAPFCREQGLQERNVFRKQLIGLQVEIKDKKNPESR